MQVLLGKTGLPAPRADEAPVKPRRIYHRPLSFPMPAKFKPGRNRISPRQAAFLTHTTSMNGMPLSTLVTMREAHTNKRDRDAFDRAVRALRDRKLIEVRLRQHRHHRDRTQRRIFATREGRAALKEFYAYATRTTGSPPLSVD